MDQAIRNKLRNVVTQCRKLLEDSISQELEGKYTIFAKKNQVTADPNATMTNLTEEEQAAREDILDHFGHIKARGFKPKNALDQLVREIAFTHLNRLCAYKMMEAREVYVNGQKFREAVSRGVNSNGVKFYLAEHEEDERLYNTGQQDVAYRHFLDWLGGTLSEEIGVLFNPNDPANRLYPRQKTLDKVLDLLNGGGIKAEDTELREQWPLIWSQDEIIGWVYQYFTPKELRDAARDPKRGGSQAPRNSYELAFRNQFFTPRYVVEFLTDNTLARIWYEMRKGDTKLVDQCQYMVRRPTEIFLKNGEQPPKDAAEGRDDLSQEELLKLPVHILHRPKKDPRELKILDPACGSGHFLLYCFDLLFTIYEEAYADPDLGPTLQNDYPKLEDLMRDVPRLILAQNLHGIDIDLRASQIAALALWLRCQRAYQEMGLKKDRPKIIRSNFVCAEPMPGEEQMLREFIGQLEGKLLGQVVEVVFDKMKLAGEAGSLLKIEEEIRGAVAAAKKQWVRETTQASERKGQSLLFTQAAMDRLAGKPEQPSLFDLSDVTDGQFFEQAEAKVIEALRQYAEKAHNGQRLQRCLFTEDAVRGFAFVDLCQKRYDVVLMNPPFGNPAYNSKGYMATAYPSCKDDIDAAFIQRGEKVLSQNGRLGAITNRTQFFKPTLANWRKDNLLGDCALDSAVDFGFGVLDALVETVAYIIRRCLQSEQTASFFRFVTVLDKSSLLSEILHPSSKRHDVTLSSFDHLPAAQIAYWASGAITRSFAKIPSLSEQYSARQGLATADNFRFLRLLWEIPPITISSSARDFADKAGKRWSFFAKGGEYAPYFGDIHLAVHWWDNASEIWSRVNEDGRPKSNIWMLKETIRKFFFRPGITYSIRTASGFSPRVLPGGCTFDVRGSSIFPRQSSEQLPLLGILMSRCFAYLLELLVSSGDTSVSGSAARSYEVGIVGSVPVPKITGAAAATLAEHVRTIWTLKYQEDMQSETSRYFVRPEWILHAHSTIREGVERIRQMLETSHLQILERTCAIEEIVRALYEMDEETAREIESEFGIHPSQMPTKNDVDFDAFCTAYMCNVAEVIGNQVEDIGGSRSLTKKSYFADRKLELLSATFGIHPKELVAMRQKAGLLTDAELRNAAHGLISYVTGCVVGHWDVRHVMSSHETVEIPEPYDQVTVCPPGMLQGKEGLPAANVPPKYPLRIGLDGILVDDAGHADDIVRQVRDALEVIWKDRFEAIEKEACETLGVRDLRNYWRGSGKGGFWDDHVSRYSKSRRKAPIYWLLQSSKKNYAIWLYYHRLDKDMLFKALVNYVEPKIRLETTRLETLRDQKAAAGESGREAKRIAKESERQEDFLSELRDFEGKLRRAANLHLEPDLNDGVVLNIAPLHELVPWKVTKKYWEELLAGKYEWSSIGKQLRQKGLVK